MAETLALALKCHQAGQHAQAEQLYQSVLAAEPNNADAWWLLGMLRHDQGRFEDAVNVYRRAIQLAPQKAELHNNLGNSLAALERWPEAERSIREALRLNPGYAKAFLNLGVALTKQNKHAEALPCYQHALKHNPQLIDAYSGMASTLWQLERFEEAAACFRTVAQLQPHRPEIHRQLAEALGRLGDRQGAAASWQNVLRLDPTSALAHHQLGTLYQEVGRLDLAEPYYRRAAQLEPENVNRINNLGVALQSLGKLVEAEACLRHALTIKADAAEVLVNLGNILMTQGKRDEAMACYQKAVESNPDLVPGHLILAIALLEGGQPNESRRHLEEAQRVQPDDLHRLMMAMSLPPVYESLEDMRERRCRMHADIRQLIDEGVAIDTTRQQLLMAPFYLAYHGENDRDIQQDLARLYTAPAFAPKPRQPGHRLRIGFLSQYFWNHTIGRLNLEIVRKLSRQRFEVFVIGGRRPGDPVADAYRQSADHYFELPSAPEQARQLIVGLGLDLLYFTDVGMDPLTYSLSFSRMARVQCVTWGHPMTTGSPAMDYFISSELLECSEADQHYSEKLIRLPHLAVAPERVAPPTSVRSRESFSLTPGGRMYACPQSLFKIHPDFDAVLADILHRDPQGEVFLLAGKHVAWDATINNRFKRTLGDVASRVHLLPALDHADFLSLNLVADVLLDPLHFGGGNTSFEAFALGRPIVTLPSAFLRGRITQALYRQMGFLDMVVSNPEQFAELACRVAMDEELQRHGRTQIQQRADVLFNNFDGAKELEDFFEQCCS